MYFSNVLLKYISQNHFFSSTCISQNIFLKIYFSKCISQNVFLKMYFSKCFSSNVFLKMYFSKCISQKRVKLNKRGFEKKSQWQTRIRKLQQPPRRSTIIYAFCYKQGNNEKQKSLHFCFLQQSQTPIVEYCWASYVRVDNR